MKDYPFVVWQIVGYKNSGKTTLMTLLIKALRKEGLRVGTVKHHGHGGEPVKTDAGTDSDRHFEAGATVSGVEGDGIFQWNVQQESWTLDELLNLYKPLNLDVVLVEGFRQEPYPKWALLRGEKDRDLLQNVLNIKGIVYNQAQPEASVPCLPCEDEGHYINTIVQQIKEELDGR